MFKEIITVQKCLDVFINYSRKILKSQNNTNNYKNYLRSTMNQEICFFI